jgi:hypothetical protein
MDVRVNKDNLNNIRCEARKYFRKKERGNIGNEQ